MPSLLLLVLFASSLFLETVVSVPQTQGSPGTAEGILISAPAASLGGPTTTAPVSSCGGCFVVAEVLGVVWYSEVFAYTAATAIVNVARGNTTGRSTSTSIIKNTEEFTFRPGETGTDANLVLTPVTYDSTANVGGAILSSPTAYNVFTAYVVNRESLGGDNVCSTILGASTTTLSSAYSEIISASAGQVILDAAGEQDFINHIGLNCRGQAISIQPQALVPVTSVTVVTTQYHNTVSRTFPSSLSVAPTSTPYSTAKTGTATRTSVLSTLTASLDATAIPESAESSAASASEAVSESGSESGTESGTESTTEPTTTIYPFATAPIIIIGSSTITPDKNPIALSLYNATSLGSGSSGVIVIVPTGTGAGAGNYTATVVPYVSKAGSWQSGHFWTSLWAATLSGMGLVMLWL